MPDVTKAIEDSEFLVARMKTLEADAYTERDSREWYVVVARGGRRLAECFSRRNDGRRLILFLCGDPMPLEWSVRMSTDLIIEIAIEMRPGDFDFCTIWRRDAEAYLNKRREAGKPYGVLP